MRGTDGSFYFGSTANKRNNRVERRFQCHKATSKRYSSKLYDHFNKLGWENVTVEEIGIFTGDKKQQHLKENEYIKPHLTNPKCLNSKQGGLTPEQKLESRKAAQQKYDEANREKRAQKCRNYYYIQKYGMTEEEYRNSQLDR